MGHSTGPKYAATAAAANNGMIANMPVKKPAPQQAIKSQQQQDTKAKDNGSWGPLFKNKDNFRNMHMY